MKVLIVTFGYFPGKEYGGPPVSVENFCSLMKNDSCYIITRNHDLSNTIPYSDVISNKWNKRKNCEVLYLADKDYNKNNFEKAVRQIKPDVIYLQSLFQRCIVHCLRIAKENNIPVILAPRGELCAGALKKKYKKIPYIMCLKFMGLLKNVIYQSTSEDETKAINKYLGGLENDICLLSNIPSISKNDYVRTCKTKGRGKFVFLSRIHPKKNLLGAIKFFDGVSGIVEFDIYGPIEDVEYWSECEKEIKKLPSNIKVTYCGLVSHEEVHAVFSKYDAFLFPTFSENYGHVIVESLLAGTPVIISDQTPWNDITKYNAGWAISLKSPDEFKNAIQIIIDCEGDYYQKKVSSYIKKKLQLETLYEQYRDMLRRAKEKGVAKRKRKCSSAKEI